MKILGNRILVSKVEEPKSEGFQTAAVQDSFVYKGRIEMIGEGMGTQTTFSLQSIILFTKYSPDTQEVDHEGQKMKIIKVEDVLAIL